MVGMSPEVPLSDQSSERHARTELEGPRSRRTETLGRTLRWLAEGEYLLRRIRCLRVEIEGVSGQIGDVKSVEYFSKHVELESLVKLDALGQAEVLRQGRLAQAVVRR